MAGKALPRISAVAAGETPLTLQVRWNTGDETLVDVAEIINSFWLYAPLRQNSDLFRRVRVGEQGADIVWADDLDISNDTLWRLAQEQSGTIRAGAAEGLMRNPFRKARYVDKLDSQLLTQWMTIENIDRLIWTSGISKYSKVEIVMLSQWATFMGFALSKANDDPKQRIECGDRLRNEIDQLLVGLNNGVAVLDEIVVPRCWIAPDGNAVPARTLFREKWEDRLAQYTRILSAPTSADDDTMRRVVEEAGRNIIPDFERSRTDLLVPYDLTEATIYKLVVAEVNRTKGLLNGVVSE